MEVQVLFAAVNNYLYNNKIKKSFDQRSFLRHTFNTFIRRGLPFFTLQAITGQKNYELIPNFV